MFYKEYQGSLRIVYNVYESTLQPEKFLIIFASLLVTGYLIFAMIYFHDTSGDQVCNSFEVIVKDSSDTHFLLPDEIRQLIKTKV